jgi:chromosome condensin MukBEF ATPase and DNA-binding subunit MukB
LADPASHDSAMVPQVRAIASRGLRCYLRLLGRDAVQRQAVAELVQSPEQPLKTFILDKITKYQIMLKSSRTLSKEDQAIMVNIEPIYEAWADEKRQEGREEVRERSDRANIAGLLVAKFGAIDPELEAVIPNLMKMDPTERSRLILTLSREALLESQ